MTQNPKADPASRRVLAYVVETDDPEDSTIQFATSNVAARRQGADEIGSDFGAVSCRRAQWADRYAADPFIPAKAYLDAGWWIECNTCGTHCHGDAARWGEESGGYIPLVLVFDGPVVYCSAECKERHDTEVAARHAEFEEFKKRVAAARPGVTFITFIGGYPYCGDSATFTFPGAQYGGSVSASAGGQDLMWYVAQGDKAAWDYFIANQPSEQAFTP